MPSENESLVSAVRRLMSRLGLKGEIISHLGQSGKDTEEAERALGVPTKSILKVIVFESREDYVIAIVTGDRRVDVKRLEVLSGLKEIRLARPEDVESFTGFNIGGVPPFVFKDLCSVFVDEEVMNRKFVIGSAGSEYVGVRFSPRELLKLGYSVAKIVQD